MTSVTTGSSSLHPQNDFRVNFGHYVKRCCTSAKEAEVKWYRPNRLVLPQQSWFGGGA